MNTQSATHATPDHVRPGTHQESIAVGPFVAQVTEEIQGKPLAGTPTKIMGRKANAMGQSAAALIKRRHPAVTAGSVESMPRLRLVAITLDSSYLIIKFT